MPGFPKPKPPANRAALERWILQKAQADGLAPARMRRAVSFMVLSAVLARFTDDTGAPLFLLKGGVAMELRVGARARASRDYDTAFRADLARLGEVLAAANPDPSRWSGQAANAYAVKNHEQHKCVSTMEGCDEKLAQLTQGQADRVEQMRRNLTIVQVTLAAGSAITLALIPPAIAAICAGQPEIYNQQFVNVLKCMNKVTFAAMAGAAAYGIEAILAGAHCGKMARHLTGTYRDAEKAAMTLLSSVSPTVARQGSLERPAGSPAAASQSSMVAPGGGSAAVSTAPVGSATPAPSPAATPAPSPVATPGESPAATQAPAADGSSSVDRLADAMGI